MAVSFLMYTLRYQNFVPFFGTLPLVLSSAVLLVVFSIPTPALAQQREDMEHTWEVIPPHGNVWDPPSPVRVLSTNELEAFQSGFAQDRIRVSQLVSRYCEIIPESQRERVSQLLIAKLRAGEEVIPVRMSMMSAAVSVSQPEQATALWEIAKSDDSTRSIVERGLIRWKSPLALGVWRERIQEAKNSSNEMLMALEGLAVVGTEEDIASLQKLIVSNRVSSADKIQAARALGAISSQGLNDLVQQVLDLKIEESSVVAACLLKRHQGERTLAQLHEIMKGGTSSSHVIAFRTLVDLNPLESQRYAEPMLHVEDHALRLIAVEVLRKLTGNENRQLLGSALVDKRPEVRRLAATKLLELAQEGERETIDSIIQKYLHGEYWEGIEQAVLMMVKLQDRSGCPRFVELLEHARPDVNMMAAYALRELGDSPECLENCLGHARRVTERVLTENSFLLTDQIRMGYLFEAFGKYLYLPANDLLLKYVPKNYTMGDPSRASAIWALGKFNHRKNNAVLRRALHERIRDNDLMMPERLLIKYASVLACGEMGRTEAFEETIETTGYVQQFFQGKTNDPMLLAAEWAALKIQQDVP